MDVEISQHLLDTAHHIGAGVPFALKVVAGRLADDPDMGRPSDLPGILTVTLDGDLIEDCPALSIGYIREPEWIQIRFVTPAPSEEPAVNRQEPQGNRGTGRDRRWAQPADTAAVALTVREVADAWRRITSWLRANAPESCAALHAGAGPAGIAALEGDLGMRMPVELSVLWMLTAGDSGVTGKGCLPGNRALMGLDAVAAVYRQRMAVQNHDDIAGAGRAREERITYWKPAWIPIVAMSPADTTSGLYLDTETGFLGEWSRFDEPAGEVLDTLVTYLEETADSLEAPTLAARDTPGLIGGTLVWLSSIDPKTEARWRPLTG